MLILERQQLERLVDQSLDGLIKAVQDAIGVTSGDVASHFWSNNPIKEELLVELRAYMLIERMYAKKPRASSKPS